MLAMLEMLASYVCDGRKSITLPPPVQGVSLMGVLPGAGSGNLPQREISGCGKLTFIFIWKGVGFLGSLGVHVKGEP